MDIFTPPSTGFLNKHEILQGFSCPRVSGASSFVVIDTRFRTGRGSVGTIEESTELPCGGFYVSSVPPILTEIILRGE